VFIITGLALAAIWMRLGVSVRRRRLESLGLLAACAAAVLACAHVRVDWDLSENRRNSFSRADDRALRQIQTPVAIDAHLAPEDPRRFDLEHGAFAKLRRTLPAVDIRYHSATSAGLFESRPDYGEIRYEVGGRTAVRRSTAEPEVLLTVFELAGIEAPGPDDGDETAFRGHPLATAPEGAAILFFGVWPALTLSIAWRVWRPS
jgi:ABC-2 type transport system permease protein